MMMMILSIAVGVVLWRDTVVRGQKKWDFRFASFIIMRKGSVVRRAQIILVVMNLTMKKFCSEEWEMGSYGGFESLSEIWTSAASDILRW